MEQLSEKLALVGTVDPQTITTGEVFTDVIDMSKYHRVMAVFMGGNMASDGSMICRAATCDSGGTNAVSLKTASTVAVGTDYSQVIIEVDELDLAGGAANKDQYIKFGIVSAGSGGPVAVAVFGELKQGIAKDYDLATVVEIETDLD
jgi:hypothetical protein